MSISPEAGRPQHSSAEGLRPRRPGAAWVTGAAAVATLIWFATTARTAAHDPPRPDTAALVGSSACGMPGTGWQLPPGHPPIGMALPPGHPPIDADEAPPQTRRLPAWHPPIDERAIEAARLPEGYVTGI